MNVLHEKSVIEPDAIWVIEKKEKERKTDVHFDRNKRDIMVDRSMRDTRPLNPLGDALKGVRV